MPCRSWRLAHAHRLDHAARSVQQLRGSPRRWRRRQCRADVRRIGVRSVYDRGSVRFDELPPLQRRWPPGLHAGVHARRQHDVPRRRHRCERDLQQHGHVQASEGERLRTVAIAILLLAAGLRPASAQPAPASDSGTGSGSEPAPSLAAENAQPSAPGDDELLKQSLAETIEIFDERPDKPFDRDTEVRLTGEQLAARGATDLGTALSLLPDVSVRDAGRGGSNIDIRGARKGAVSVLIDGVVVTDPYYGTFDVSTIPITDIVQIRVSTAPQSPIDGPGGPGGVIEVLTRDAIGPRLVIARLTADTLPSLGVTATARTRLADHLALRVSASGQASDQDFATPTTASVPSGRKSAAGAARLEYRDKVTRVVLDGFFDDRHYLSPPSDEDATMALLLIDRETTERVSAKIDHTEDDWQLQAQGWVHHLFRRSQYFSDDGLTDQTALEDLTALRTGGLALATRPRGKEFRVAASAGHDYNKLAVGELIGNSVKASLTLVELALDAQYEHETIRIDAAGGVALPFVYGGCASASIPRTATRRSAPSRSITSSSAASSSSPTSSGSSSRRSSSIRPARC